MCSRLPLYICFSSKALHVVIEGVAAIFSMFLYYKCGGWDASMKA